MRRAVLAFAVLCALPGAAAAQPVIPGAAAPYQDSLLRLSEILGALHHLEAICGNGPSPWRDKMQALLDAQGFSDAARQLYVDRFNRGYLTFQTMHRTCTPSASLARDRYIAEAAEIAADLIARYGT